MTEGLFVNESAAAEYLGLAPKTLRRWRWAGKGPRFRKFGRSVRYGTVDLAEYAMGAASH